MAEGVGDGMGGGMRSLHWRALRLQKEMSPSAEFSISIISTFSLKPPSLLASNFPSKRAV